MSFKTDIDYRKQSLLKLLDCIERCENEIIEALYHDFKKPPFESVATETAYIVSELKNTIKNIKSWARPKRVLPALLNFPSTDYLYSEPYGEVLIIAPWNYPYQLALCPTIAAVAAGNKVVLKPSELTPRTADVIQKIIKESFAEDHVRCVLGGAEVSEKLLQQRWDYIFFTGSVAVGKLVAKAAAAHLTPVTLELGGKNPCIVEESAPIQLAAKRIVWGKFLNAGQTCIAPDYVMVDEKVKDKFVTALKSEIEKAYGKDPRASKDFARIVNEKNWSRLTAMLRGEAILHGGQSDITDFYVAPTLLDGPGRESQAMSEEIFGPILPIIPFKSHEEVKKTITGYEKPLSLFIFTTDMGSARRTIKEYSFGGGCINDTVIHFSNSRLPFGGVGNSGMGAYHGKRSFDTFSHKKPVVKKANWLDIPVRYAPFAGKLKNLRRLLKWLS